MVNLLIASILSGLAVTFAIEASSLILGLVTDKQTIYGVLSLPFSFGAMFCFYNPNKMFIVSVPAVAFVVLVLNKYLNKPAVFTANRRQLPPL